MHVRRTYVFKHLYLPIEILDGRYQVITCSILLVECIVLENHEKVAISDFYGRYQISYPTVWQVLYGSTTIWTKVINVLAYDY